MPCHQKGAGAIPKVSTSDKHRVSSFRLTCIIVLNYGHLHDWTDQHPTPYLPRFCARPMTLV